MAQAANQELVDRFEEFYRQYYADEVGELARKYPREQKSLTLDWRDVYRFDPDLGEDLIRHPDEIREAAKEALRLYDLPVDVKLGKAHVRIKGLTEHTEIRDIRAEHLNTLVSAKGIVRKATDVRPKIQEAVFVCQRCGAETVVPQSEGGFQEPYQCESCERQGPFKLNAERSEFVDAQKLRIQESPEGLGGGETPQALDIHIEDDVTGKVSPGDHVTATGILRLDQSESGKESPIFDIYMEGSQVVIEDEQFEEMNITEEDEERIHEISKDPDIYDKMVGSIAPAIYGHDQAKLAMALQLFSGVTKHLPDGSRIRGDLHMLLIGDPGTGKCVSGDTRVALSDGTEHQIRELVEANLDDPKPIDDGVWDDADIDIPTLADDGTIRHGKATRVWKREAPERLYRIITASGSKVDVTPSHPLFIQQNGVHSAIRAEDLSEGDFIATPGQLPSIGEDQIDISYRRSKSTNPVRLDLPTKWTPSLARLIGLIVAEGYVDRRPNNTALISITNNDEEVLAAAESAMDALGINVTRRQPHQGMPARELICSSSEFASFLDNLDAGLCDGSAEKRVPRSILGASTETKASFLQAFIEGEGHVSANQREITVASMSETLLKDVRAMLRTFGIRSQIHERRNESYRLRISGSAFDEYVHHIGFLTVRKLQAAERHVDGSKNTNLDIVPGVGELLRWLRTELGLTQSECGLPRSTYQHYERGDRNPSRTSLRAVLDRFEAALSDTTDTTTVRADGGMAVQDAIQSIRRLVDGDVHWERIETIEAYEPSEEWVYDLEVAGTHNYVTNGVISHNSQLLAYVKNIAPRSVYTSGKGTSSAGLCVTGDTLVHTSEGLQAIADIVERDIPEPVTEETPATRAIDVCSYDRDAGAITRRSSSHVWRMPKKPCRRIETRHGKELEASLNTPVLTCGEHGIEWKAIADIEQGDYVAVPRYDDLDREPVPVREFLELTNEKVKLTPESVSFVRDGLYETYGTLREAAAALELSEDLIYTSLAKRHIPLEKLDRMLDAIDATRRDVQFERVMLRHGDSITVPRTFDEDLMYLLGLVFGDGDIALDRRGGNRGMVRISNGDEALLERAIDIFAAKFDKRVEIERQDGRVPCIRVTSTTIARLFANAGMQTPKQDLELDPRLTTAAHADAFIRGLMDADGSVSSRTNGGSSLVFSSISEKLSRQLQLMLETYGVRARIRERDRRGRYELDDGKVIESKHIQYFVECHGSDIERYANTIGFGSIEKRQALEQITGDAVRRGEKIPIGAALATVDGPAGQCYQNIRRGDNPGRSRARSMLRDVDLGETTALVEEAVEAPLRWDEVAAAVDTGEKEVFDLTVPETHNFVGNGILTHNTAAAVRDDFGDGNQWTLEAGALVLADMGIAAVDELDKMDSDDRSALHEALEQQSISISKAGINATLKSRCSLLGAANPKYGRFDQYEPIGEQIDLEPALVSRFDLIFTMTDKPNEAEDSRLAQHILQTNYAGELNTQRDMSKRSKVTEEDIANETREVAPAIESDILRKYIAYSRRNCFPTMTPEAKQAIEDFYVDLRSRGADEDAPVPVTARQLEAIVRLAEASARVRLSDTVEEEDATRVIGIVRDCLSDIGIDPETGEFDADVIETGRSKTQRDRVKDILSIVESLESEFDEGAPIEEVLDTAEEHGTERSKAEHQIENLKQKGELYEPSQGHLRTT